MPQLNKGGKYVFGWSLIREGGVIYLPTTAVAEYHLSVAPEVILFTGSKSTGGFCVTNLPMLANSQLKAIVDQFPELVRHAEVPGRFLPYKGRSYAWLPVTPDGTIRLSEEALAFLRLDVGDRLMAIRSSNIAFTMGAKGPLLERGRQFPGEIPTF